MYIVYIKDLTSTPKFVIFEHTYFDWKSDDGYIVSLAAMNKKTARFS